MAYITKVNGAWTSPVLLNTGATAFNRDASIGYTRANGTLTLHVVFMGGKSGSENDKHIFSVRKVGGAGWEPPRLRQSNSGGGFPKLVTDLRSKVYGVWQVNSSSYGYEPYFSRSLDNGTNWTTPQAVGSKTADIGQTPAIARTSSGKVAVLWEDEYRTSDMKRDIFSRISEDDGANWSGAKDISPSAGFSRNVAATANESSFQAAWHDERRGSYQIYFSTYAVGVIFPSATPLLDNGLPTTRNNTVTVSFSNVIGSPDSVRYHWDAPPTDADAWVAFASPLTIAGPTGVTAEACQNHTLYTQVRRSTTNGLAAQDSELFDIGVQAQVNILNPHLASLPAAGNGASDGDPNYTRDPSFYLGISGFTDCSGLSTFSVASGASGSITNNRYVNTLALPGGSAVTADNANSIIRSLSFKNISVDDNLYGQQANLRQLASGKQFWGVWIANTTSPTTTVDVPSLNWYPVRVAAPNSSFTVTWDLFSGMGFTTDLRNKPGDYYVFVRFLDGAGNASTGSLKVKVTLAAGYDIPTLRLPIQAR